MKTNSPPRGAALLDVVLASFAEDDKYKALDAIQEYAEALDQQILTLTALLNVIAQTVAGVRSDLIAERESYLRGLDTLAPARTS